MVDTASNLTTAGMDSFVIVEVTQTRAKIKTADGATMAALAMPAFLMTLDNPRVPDISVDLTATANHSSKVYNVWRTSVSATLPNNVTCLLQLFVWNDI
jgi:hypothetical protein